MLQSLHVRNLALIDETEVEFAEGLNVLSGETGAGKSIIIGSMNLALGEKVPKEMLRDNGESAFVELIFGVENEKLKQKLLALDVEPEDDMVILSRKITSGRAVGRINGEAASASRMREVASLLIDIHGQHEHQSLLSKKRHLEILDEYAGEMLEARKQELAVCYQEYRKLREQWEHSNLDREEQRRELSFLEYEVNEIQKANVTPGEDEQLEADYRKFSNGRKIIEALNNAHGATGGDEQSAAELVGYAIRQLSSISEYDRKIASMEEQLAELEDLLGDFNHEISAYLSDSEFDEEVFVATQRRLDEINHLKSKYGNSIEEILEECTRKQQRIEVLTDYDNYLSDLSNKLNKQEKQLNKLCEEVSKIRQEQAAVLAEAIRSALADLNFLNVEFTMEFQRTSSYTANGYDDAQFLISTNPGEPPKPLEKVASGGELSRIMLAIKTIMADQDEIGTLIFDEIDSGISGRTAQMVAEKMNVLGRSHQIICITHLPQIAAMADHHFLIEKSVENESTVSRIYRLDENASIKELARMLGGVEITDTVLQNAKEMKDLAYMKK